MPEQVAVCACCAVRFVFCARFFSERECYRAVRMSGFYILNNRNYFFCCKIVIFPALQNKCAESERVSFIAARTYFFFNKTVALRMFIAPPDAAVVAVVFAAVRKFNKPADINAGAV